MCIVFPGRNNSEQGLRQMSQADKVQCNFLSEVNAQSSSRKRVKDDEMIVEMTIDLTIW